ncbi:MAG: type II toxin-antitoxin system prevent-host-death family antitoxin [Paracoccus sp. (in: a-proteobacteria)]|nr:type II toxin-antitoxin system prevent-host-death family antitoxin [Paracoccus sp. (in: a-proteobacteria)]
MQISVSDAKAQLTELIRRAEAGDEVFLTRHGRAVAQLTPVHAPVDAAARQAVIQRMQVRAAAKAGGGPGAARSQDFLYDDDGLPG